MTIIKCNEVIELHGVICCGLNLTPCPVAYKNEKCVKDEIDRSLKALRRNMFRGDNKVEE